MQNMYARLTWINILTKNAMICLIWNIYNSSHGHWLNKKSKINGVSDVLEEVENEFWGYASHEGPFEHTEEDFRKWLDYINSKKDILMKKISDIQNRLLEVQGKMDSIYKDNNRKDPATDVSRTKGSPYGSLSSLRDTSQTLKQYLAVLKNWAMYLEEVKTSWGEGIPVVEIQRMMNELENQKEGTVDERELLKINSLLKNFRKKMKTGKGKADITCNETDSKIGNVIRQVQKNFSETFLYKNITLTEINQMSKIVDFIDRYRGRMEKILGLDNGENVAESDTTTGKKLRVAEATEN